MHLVLYSGSKKICEKGFSGIESRRGGDRGDLLTSVGTGMVIQKSTVPVLSLAIPVKYVCRCGNPGFAALVPATYRSKITLPLWVALPVPLGVIPVM